MVTDPPTLKLRRTRVLLGIAATGIVIASCRQAARQPPGGPSVTSDLVNSRIIPSLKSCSPPLKKILNPADKYLVTFLFVENVDPLCDE